MPSWYWCEYLDEVQGDGRHLIRCDINWKKIRYRWRDKSNFRSQSVVISPGVHCFSNVSHDTFQGKISIRREEDKSWTMKKVCKKYREMHHDWKAALYKHWKEYLSALSTSNFDIGWRRLSCQKGIQRKKRAKPFWKNKLRPNSTDFTLFGLYSDYITTLYWPVRGDAKYCKSDSIAFCIVLKNNTICDS